MASEKAKELARQQKAQVKAEKLRKKNSDDPRDWGQTRQVRESFKLVRKHNPRFVPMAIAAVAVPVVVAIILCLIVGYWAFLIPLGILVGIALALVLFNRELKKSVFEQAHGQVGSTGVALQMLPKGWSHSQMPVAMNREQDVILRAVGPAGIVLVGEGDQRRLRPMMNTEVKRHSAVQHQVVVTPIFMGDGDNQVPLNRLSDHIRKLPKKYESAQVTDLERRVAALDAVRPRLGGMPHGPVNQRGSRRALRGR